MNKMFRLLKKIYGNNMIYWTECKCKFIKMCLDEWSRMKNQTSNNEY